MILNKTIHPERDLYYLWSKIIEAMSLFNQEEFDYFELFISLNKQTKISLNLYSLSLDWLFIIGVIEKSNNWLIKKCF